MWSAISRSNPSLHHGASEIALRACTGLRTSGNKLESRSWTWKRDFEVQGKQKWRTLLENVQTGHFLVVKTVSLRRRGYKGCGRWTVCTIVYLHGWLCLQLKTFPPHRRVYSNGGDYEKGGQPNRKCCRLARRDFPQSSIRNGTSCEAS